MKINASRVSVAINGRFLTRRQTGVDRFAIELAREISIANNLSSPDATELDVRIFVPHGTFKDKSFHGTPIYPVGNFRGQAWEQFDLSIASAGHILLNLCNSAPLILKNQLTVIHDAAPARVPESYSWQFRRWYGLMIPTLYKRSASVCTVSNFSKSDLAKLYGTRADVKVLPEGTDHMNRIESDLRVLDTHQLRTRPYVFAVSSLSPHKNFSAVVQAVQLMGNVDFDVVIAGGQNPKVFAAGGDSLPDSVKYVGYVSDSELKALYENAACFVFPSIYEGYGLPPTEAMSCGCPVVAARAASIPEVCGDAALYFDPHNPQELASLLQRMMGDANLRNTMAERGRARASTMRWRNTALALLEEIRRVAQ